MVGLDYCEFAAHHVDSGPDFVHSRSARQKANFLHPPFEFVKTDVPSDGNYPEDPARIRTRNYFQIFTQLFLGREPDALPKVETISFYLNYQKWLALKCVIVISLPLRDSYVGVLPPSCTLRLLDVILSDRKSFRQNGRPYRDDTALGLVVYIVIRSDE